MKEAIIIKNKALGADFFLISLKWSAAPKVRPGQFVMLRVTGSMDPLLRRPFSGPQTRLAAPGYLREKYSSD